MMIIILQPDCQPDTGRRRCKAAASEYGTGGVVLTSAMRLSNSGRHGPMDISRELKGESKPRSLGFHTPVGRSLLASVRLGLSCPSR